MAQRILVLDDEENYADMLKALLEQHLFLVDSVTEPARALEHLQGTGYDLVISDFKMPSMDGADFLSRSREINPDLPVILVSGLMNTPDLVKVANMGVTLVLEKPIDIQQFISQVKRFVAPATKEEFRLHRQGHNVETVNDELSKFKRTYPEELTFLSDNSLVFRFFLESLWKASNEQDHIFVSMPPGGESDLLVREVSQWRKFSTRIVRWLDLRHPDIGHTEAMLKKLSESSDESFLVGVIGFEGSTLPAQANMVDCIRESPENLSFLYLIENGLLEKDHQPVNPELLELLAQSLCVMPPLNARLSDVAAYAKQYVAKVAVSLEAPERATLEPEAGALLLQHDWPGNFRELIDVVRVAVAIRSEGSVSVGDVSEALRRVSSVELATASFEPLDSAIKQRQQFIISSAMQESGQDLAATLGSLGVDPQAVNAEIGEENLPLIYPELLK